MYIRLRSVQAADPARSLKLPDVTAESQTGGQARQSFAPSLHALGVLIFFDKRVAIVGEEP